MVENTVPDEDPIVINDPFQAMVLISLNRIYDAQMALLATLAGPKAAELAALHEQGGTLSPPYRAQQW